MCRQRAPLLGLLLLACVPAAACAVVRPIGPRPQDREPVPPLLGTAPAEPAGGSWDPDAAPTSLSIGFGAAYWDEIGSLSTAGTGLDPDQFGRFDHGGFYFDLGFDHVVGAVGDWPLALGLEFGLASFDNDGRGTSVYSDRLTATWMRITPTAHLMIPLADGLHLRPGLGLGGGLLSIDEYDDAYSYSWGWVTSTRNLYDEWTLDAFVDLGLDIDLADGSTALRIDNELHWVEFDGIGALLPAESAVGGPIYTLQLALVMRF